MKTQFFIASGHKNYSIKNKILNIHSKNIHSRKSGILNFSLNNMRKVIQNSKKRGQNMASEPS